MAQQGSSRPLRPIAPRTTPGDLTPSNPESSEEGKAKRASIACAECKRRRTKCSYDTTGSPCSECSLKGCECAVDESADKRRKAAGKRIQEELILYQDTLKLAQEQVKNLQQELHDSKQQYSMVLMEKERALAAALTYLDKLLGVLRIDKPEPLDVLVKIVRSGAEKPQVLEVLDRIMPYDDTQTSSTGVVSGNSGSEREPDSIITYLAPDGLP